MMKETERILQNLSEVIKITPDIIRAAGKSYLTLIALIFICLSVITIILFQYSSDVIKVVVFFPLLSGILLILFVLLEHFSIDENRRV